MNLALLLSIISVTQLPRYTFGKSPTKVVAGTKGPTSGIDRHKDTPSVNADDEWRLRRNSASNDDDDDFLINRLSREYVTSNLFDPTTACNK